MKVELELELLFVFVQGDSGFLRSLPACFVNVSCSFTLKPSLSVNFTLSLAFFLKFIVFVVYFEAFDGTFLDIQRCTQKFFNKF